MGNFMTGLVSSWADVAQRIKENNNKIGLKEGLASNWDWLITLMNTMSIILWVALALVGAAGGIFALYVGIKMARADSSEERDENKKRMINIIVTIVVVILLILIMNIFLPMILDAFHVFDLNVSTGNGSSGSGSSG